MKITPKANLFDITGNTVQVSPSDPSPVTFEHFAFTALNNAQQGEKIQPKEAFQRFKLIKKLTENEDAELDLNLDEIILLKKAIEAHYSNTPWYFGQLMEILEVK